MPYTKNSIQVPLSPPDGRAGLGITNDPSVRGGKFGVAGGLNGGSGEQISNMIGRPVAGIVDTENDFYDERLELEEDEVNDDAVRRMIDPSGGGTAGNDPYAKSAYIGGRVGGLGQRALSAANTSRGNNILREYIQGIILELGISGRIAASGLGNHYRNNGKGQSRNSNRDKIEDYTHSGPKTGHVSKQGKSQAVRYEDSFDNTPDESNTDIPDEGNTYISVNPNKPNTPTADGVSGHNDKFFPDKNKRIFDIRSDRSNNPRDHIDHEEHISYKIMYTNIK